MQVVKAFECSTQGPRKEMQDVTLKMPGPDGAYYMAVFDGHLAYGADIAEEANRSVRRAARSKAASFNSATEHAWFMRSVMRSLHKRLAYDPRGSVSGSTATVATIKNDEVAVAWLGDSEAVFYPDHGRSIKFVNPHNYKNQAEVERVRSIGYTVKNRYFGGALAVSRAIGDWRHGFISGEASISKAQKLGGPGTLVVASDGIWGPDGQYHSKVEEYVRSLRDPLELQVVAEDLVSLLANWTEDNASMVAAYIA